ncbi:M48 family metallopeptidase [Variovorax sp. HJSM1_2]|uniref:M48 family metallopeptidase n=1 Tax=Variovorax sp. HJSM1_2 TaxID=3366263 RepID=UPI003BE407AD
MPTSKLKQLLQYTLDLFEPALMPAPAPEPASTPAPPKPRAPQRPRISRNKVAEPAGAAGLAGTKLEPVRFHHPRANRLAHLPGAEVGFEFKRAKRRTIGFLVGVDGLTVRAPKWVPLAEVDAAVMEKAGWILQKLGDARIRAQRQEGARIDWRDGAELPFLGERVLLVLDPTQALGKAGAVLAAAGAEGQPRQLLVGLPQHAQPAQIRDVVQAWLMREAKAIFLARLQHFAPLLGVQWQKLSLSNAGTRWGSASTSGAIRLNWRLVHFSMPVIDYVVAHELSHLRVMDHSQRFWDTVGTVMPDYAERRGLLKQVPIPKWD